jgi:hypothetical protein
VIDFPEVLTLFLKLHCSGQLSPFSDQISEERFKGSTDHTACHFVHFCDSFNVWASATIGTFRMPFSDNTIFGDLSHSNFQVCVCSPVCSSCSPTSTDYSYTTILVLSKKIEDEASTKIGVEIGPPLEFVMVIISTSLFVDFSPKYIRFLFLFYFVQFLGVE